MSSNVILVFFLQLDKLSELKTAGSSHLKTIFPVHDSARRQEDAQGRTRTHKDARGRTRTHEDASVHRFEDCIDSETISPGEHGGRSAVETFLTNESRISKCYLRQEICRR